MIIVLLFFIFFIAAAYMLYRFYPPFGGRTRRTVKMRSSNFKNGKFVNQIPTSMTMSISDTLDLLRAQRKQPSVKRKPDRPLIPERLDVSKSKTMQPQITWFGHSTFLLQIDGKSLLLDPVFSNAVSPVQAFGPKRFADTLPASLEELPPIDAVVISHDHYDHLDYGSVKKLSAKTSMFFVPIGLAAHLIKWGVNPDKITELDWWDEREFNGLTLACTPSRHFSGRTLTDRYATLWCSWAIRTNDTSVFFSGDSGYGPHFEQIGEKYGPFDLTLLECGQYNTLWADIHMTPEQTIKAHQDLKGERMIPMHWGAFSLAPHDWTEPVERALVAAKTTGTTFVTPKIGQTVMFKTPQYPTEKWWEAYK